MRICSRVIRVFLAKLHLRFFKVPTFCDERPHSRGTHQRICNDKIGKNSKPLDDDLVASTLLPASYNLKIFIISNDRIYLHFMSIDLMTLNSCETSFNV